MGEVGAAGGVGVEPADSCGAVCGLQRLMPYEGRVRYLLFSSFLSIGLK